VTETQKAHAAAQGVLFISPGTVFAIQNASPIKLRFLADPLNDPSVTVFTIRSVKIIKWICETFPLNDPYVTVFTIRSMKIIKWSRELKRIKLIFLRSELHLMIFTDLIVKTVTDGSLSGEVSQIHLMIFTDLIVKTVRDGSLSGKFHKPI
jgi:hypothetical protein